MINPMVGPQSWNDFGSMPTHVGQCLVKGINLKWPITLN